MCTRNRRMNFRKRCTIDWPAVLAACFFGSLLLLTSVRCEAADLNFVIDILECESSGLHLNDKGKFHCNEKEPTGGKSCGIAAFQQETFDEMKIKAGMPKLRWKNSIHQLRLMSWMLDHGYGRRWTCYRTLTEGKK